MNIIWLKFLDCDHTETQGLGQCSAGKEPLIPGNGVNGDGFITGGTSEAQAFQRQHQRRRQQRRERRTTRRRRWRRERSGGDGGDPGDDGGGGPGLSGEPSSGRWRPSAQYFNSNWTQQTELGFRPWAVCFLHPEVTIHAWNQHWWDAVDARCITSFP